MEESWLKICQKLVIDQGVLEPLSRQSTGHHNQYYPAEAAHEKRTKTRCA